jgi:CMP-N,N'-diacetyllegionaminic acid synthase
VIEDKKVLAVVPARSGSKGLPGKNIKLLAEKPLLAWPISAACGTPEVDRIILSTDSEDIAEVGRLAGADVPFIRPSELATDETSSTDVILHAIQDCEDKGQDYEYVILLEPTSPLTESADISEALKKLHSSRHYVDSIVGVSSIEANHPEYSVTKNSKGIISPAFSDDFKSLRRRQNIEELYFLDGSLYISRVEPLKETKSFYGSKTMGFPVPRWKSFEVDELVDFICIEAVMNRRNELS